MWTVRARGTAYPYVLYIRGFNRIALLVAGCSTLEHVPGSTYRWGQLVSGCVAVKLHVALLSRLVPVGSWMDALKSQ